MGDLGLPVKTTLSSPSLAAFHAAKAMCSNLQGRLTVKGPGVSESGWEGGCNNIHFLRR